MGPHEPATLAAALDWARSCREARAEAIAEAVAHDSLEPLLPNAREPGLAGAVQRFGAEVTSLKLLTVMDAVPSCGGKVKSRRLLAALGLEHSVALGAVTPDQAAALMNPSDQGDSTSGVNS